MNTTNRCISFSWVRRILHSTRRDCNSNNTDTTVTSTAAAAAAATHQLTTAQSTSNTDDDSGISLITNASTSWPLVRCLNSLLEEDESTWGQIYAEVLGEYLANTQSGVSVCTDVSRARNATTQHMACWIALARVVDDQSVGALSDTPVTVAQHCLQTIRTHISDAGAACLGVMYVTLQLYEPRILRIGNPSCNPTSRYEESVLHSHTIRALEMQYALLFDETKRKKKVF